MPKDKDAAKRASDLDSSLNEGTMRDYEAFCVYCDDSEGSSSQDYEIFIVSTGSDL